MCSWGEILLRSLKKKKNVENEYSYKNINIYLHNDKNTENNFE